MTALEAIIKMQGQLIVAQNAGAAKISFATSDIKLILDLAEVSLRKIDRLVEELERLRVEVKQ